MSAWVRVSTATSDATSDARQFTPASWVTIVIASAEEKVPMLYYPEGIYLNQLHKAYSLWILHMTTIGRRADAGRTEVDRSMSMRS